MRLAWVVALASLAACKSTAHGDDASTPAPTPTPTPAIAESAPVKDAEPVDPLAGEWERRTEPYVGMRIRFAAGRATVTLAPPVTDERVKPGVTKAHLECQRSLWRPDEELVSGLRPAPRGYDATIIVRDWGLAGTCRHADTRAPAHLVVHDDELAIDVTRGKTTTPQRWARVGP